jgi:tetratricopeptide (TPR) repeat protein
MIRQKSPQKVPISAGRREKRWRAPAICLVLAAITFAVFGQTLRHDFVGYDDDDYVYKNPVVAKGLTLKGFVWAFSCHAYNWHPLTWISHMLDCQLYGLHPGGHHLTNVLLHTATVIALFLVLWQMTGALWRSAFVAAVFAIHPLRVESVAWVAERKDVLSGLFFMLTIGAYVRYARRPWSLARYGLVVLLFAMGLMCKPMLVTLPVVLVLLDYWPLQRVESAGILVMEKLPLLALSATTCAATLLAQNRAIQSTESYSMPQRLANALAACMVYLGQMVWPAGLAVLYPYSINGLPGWEVAPAGILLAGLSVLAWGEWRTRPWLLIGWVWYLVMLLPVVGVIQVGHQAHADRYTYLPQIGIYVGVTWLVAEWWARGLHHGPLRVALGGLMAGVLAVLMVCAWKQTTYWQDSETLWNHTLACTTKNEMAHYNLGYALYQKGRAEEAITQYREALHINPANAKAHYNLGVALFHKGKVEEAISQYQEALHINPANEEAHNNLGIALFQKGKAEEAISHFLAALQITPDDAQIHHNLGNAFYQKGRVDEAITQFQEALQFKPDFAETHYSLGNALRQKGRVDEAIVQYQETLQFKPSHGEAHNNLGTALRQRGRVDEAISHYQKALEIMPDNESIHVNLANALLQKGRVDQAIVHFQNALQIEPADMEVQNNLAWLLATCPQASLRNGDKAVQLARQANELAGGKNPVILGTLAAAFAEAGRFGDAVQSAQKAIGLARAAGRQDVAGKLNGELQRYEAGLPLHQ